MKKRYLLTMLIMLQSSFLTMSLMANGNDSKKIEFKKEVKEFGKLVLKRSATLAILGAISSMGTNIVSLGTNLVDPLLNDGVGTDYILSRIADKIDPSVKLNLIAKACDVSIINARSPYITGRKSNLDDVGRHGADREENRFLQNRFNYFVKTTLGGAALGAFVVAPLEFGYKLAIKIYQNKFKKQDDTKAS